ncbi:MAG: hypothetical protein EZS28_021811, partial [Streblomastix strix]
PSMKSGFRGTIRYASANSHRKRELGRQDDLMSLIYIFVEFYTGTLPWVNIVDPDEVMRLKELYQGGSLFANMPSEFMEFEDHILSLDYTTEPDYLLLASLFPDSSNDIKQGLTPISPTSLSITPSKSNQSNLLQTPNEQLSIKQIQFPTIKTDSNDSSNFDDSNSKSNNSSRPTKPILRRHERQYLTFKRFINFRHFRHFSQRRAPYLCGQALYNEPSDKHHKQSISRQFLTFLVSGGQFGLEITKNEFIESIVQIPVG